MEARSSCCSCALERTPRKWGPSQPPAPATSAASLTSGSPSCGACPASHTCAHDARL